MRPKYAGQSKGMIGPKCGGIQSKPTAMSRPTRVPRGENVPLSEGVLCSRRAGMAQQLSTVAPLHDGMVLTDSHGVGEVGYRGKIILLPPGVVG